MPDLREAPDMTSRSFPWRCPRCREKEVRPAVIPYQIEVAHDGCRYRVDIPQLTVPRCDNCGELAFGNHACEQIEQAVRVQLHLLSPEQIRGNRE